jgi:hypothetical protein
MQEWEYFKYYSPTYPTAEELNDYGEDRWELVTIIEGTAGQLPEGFLSYFKRIRAPTSE